MPCREPGPAIFINIPESHPATSPGDQMTSVHARPTRAMAAAMPETVVLRLSANSSRCLVRTRIRRSLTITTTV